MSSLKCKKSSNYRVEKGLRDSLQSYLRCVRSDDLRRTLRSAAPWTSVPCMSTVSEVESLCQTYRITRYRIKILLNITSLRRHRYPAKTYPRPKKNVGTSSEC